MLNKPATPNMQSRILQVASSFTSRPLAATLQPWVVNAGIADDLAFVEYAPIAEYMLGGAFEEAPIVGTLVLVRVEDWIRGLKPVNESNPESGEETRQRLAASVNEFFQQLANLCGCGKPVWLLVCPSHGWISEKHNLVALCRTYSNLLAARAKNLRQVTSLPWPTSLANDQIHDRNADRLGQIPFTRQAFEQLGHSLGEQIKHTFRRRAVSVERTSTNGKGELAKYLCGLSVCVRLYPVQAGDRSYVDKILRTAAAFSLTGEKPDLSPLELETVLASGECMLISVSDKLGSYGPTGVVAYRVSADLFLVNTLALTCPVLGKQVEYAVLSALAQMAASRNCAKLTFPYQPSGRNQIMLGFLRSISDGDSDLLISLPTARVEETIKKIAVAPGAWTLDCSGKPSADVTRE